MWHRSYQKEDLFQGRGLKPTEAHLKAIYVFNNKQCFTIILADNSDYYAVITNNKCWHQASKTISFEQYI